MEIVQKIISKIAAGEDFVVYALIPMFPEGDPNGTAGQEILLYQWRTIDAMYRFGPEDFIFKVIRGHQCRQFPSTSQRVFIPYSDGSPQLWRNINRLKGSRKGVCLLIILSSFAWPNR